jgi:hypothetical protein
MDKADMDGVKAQSENGKRKEKIDGTIWYEMKEADRACSTGHGATTTNQS